MSERTISDPKPQLKRLEQTQISKQLQEKYREVSLSEIFPQNHNFITEHGVPYHVFAKFLFRRADTSSISTEPGKDILDYEDTIFHSIDSFIEDCISYGLIQVSDNDLLTLELTDPTLCELERDGLKIQLNRSFYSVYQERMDTTGSIDTKPNGEYAVEGVTAESARSW